MGTEPFAEWNDRTDIDSHRCLYRGGRSGGSRVGSCLLDRDMTDEEVTVTVSR
jgi:hypothetical protein